MSRQRKSPKGKTINPTLFVFCEGQTEVSYINLLKTLFRIPSIHIHAKIGGNNISDNYILNYKKDKPTHEKDLNFLMYDLDVPSIQNRLNSINDAIPLLSNPCIELWFLLHYKNQTANISCQNCSREISNRNRNTYKKGLIDEKLKDKLLDRMSNAMERAKILTLFNNPSSSVYRLIEILKDLKN